MPRRGPALCSQPFSALSAVSTPSVAASPLTPRSCLNRNVRQPQTVDIDGTIMIQHN